MNSCCSGVSIPPGATQFAADLALEVLVGEDLREVDDARLRRAVRGAVGLRLDAGVRRDVDDRTATVEQVRNRGLTHEERAREVDGEDALPVLERHFVRVREPTDARAVDGQLHAAQVRRRAVDRRTRRHRIGHVGGVGLGRTTLFRDRGRRLLRRVTRDVETPDERALGCEPHCGRLPEPRTRARDDCHPILEPTHP